MKIITVWDTDMGISGFGVWFCGVCGGGVGVGANT